MPCNCPDCRTSRDPNRRCDRCDHLESECVCTYCASCGEYQDPSETTCEECGYGPCCCRCDRAEIPYCDPTNRFHGEPSKRFPRYLGVEIECFLSNVKRRQFRALAERWGAGITSDGSIRPDGGSLDCEYVTAPARGDAFRDQIRDTCETLNAQGAAVNKSTGLHVHVDARDFTTRDILAFTRLYARVEKSLYSLVAKARRTNTYSQPWGDKLTDTHPTSEGPCSALDDHEPLTKREKALDIATYGSESHAREVKRARYKDSSRYHGVNFNALAIHGTIEFRLHHGTTNATKIGMWAAVCSALVCYAKDHTEEEIKHLRGTPAEILAKVVNDPAVSRWCSKRREHFETIDRQRRGLAPRARPVTPPAAPSEEIPAMPFEGGEDAATPPRARPMYR